PLSALYSNSRGGQCLTIVGTEGGAVAGHRGDRSYRARAPIVGLIEDLGRGPVTLDTAVFIYFMEEHPRYLSVVEPVFAAMDGARLQAVTSGVTLLETLVLPYR